MTIDPIYSEFKASIDTIFKNNDKKTSQVFLLNCLNVFPFESFHFKMKSKTFQFIILYFIQSIYIFIYIYEIECVFVCEYMCWCIRVSMNYHQKS